MKNTPAFYHNRLPVHEVAFRRTKKNQRAHQIIRHLQPLDRALFELQFVERLGRILPLIFHQTGGDRINTNPELADLAGERAGHTDKRRFRSDIVEKVRRTQYAVDDEILII